MALPRPGVGEVLGAQVRGVENAGLLPLHQAVQLPHRERASLAAGTGEGKIHPQPLKVQGQPPAKAALGLLQPLAEDAAGEGGADQNNGMVHRLAVGLRHEQPPVISAEHPPQVGQKAGPVRAGRRLKVRQHAAVAPGAALPPHVPAQGGAVPDRTAALVPQNHHPAPGGHQQVAAGQAALGADPVGHVGQPVGEAGGRAELVGRDGQIELHGVDPPL